MTRGKLPLSIKLSYGCGKAAEGVKTRVFEFFLFFYFVQVLGVSGTGAGVAVAVALCVGTFASWQLYGARQLEALHQ